MRNHKKSLVLVALSFFTAIAANAATLFDSGGFEAPTYALGSLTGQNGWLTDGTGAATVQSSVVESGSQAVTLSGATTSWHYPDLSYTPGLGEIVSVTSGIRRGSSTVATKNFGYFLDAYNPAVARFARVGLGVSGGAPALVASTISAGVPGNYLLETGLAWDMWYDFRLDLKFDTQNFDLYVNGVLKGANLPFLTAASAIADVDLQMSATAGATDVGYFDNYKIVTMPVPEPGVISIAALGGFACVLLRRRNRK